MREDGAESTAESGKLSLIAANGDVSRAAAANACGDAALGALATCECAETANSATRAAIVATAAIRNLITGEIAPCGKV